MGTFDSLELGIVEIPLAQLRHGHPFGALLLGHAASAGLASSGLQLHMHGDLTTQTESSCQASPEMHARSTAHAGGKGCGA